MSEEREWWRRVLAVPVRPRVAFAGLRDDRPEAVDARQEPILALILLLGLAVALGGCVVGSDKEQSSGGVDLGPDAPVIEVNGSSGALAPAARPSPGIKPPPAHDVYYALGRGPAAAPVAAAGAVAAGGDFQPSGGLHRRR